MQLIANHHYGRFVASAQAGHRQQGIAIVTGGLS